jgi:hypothetical protein
MTPPRTGAHAHHQYKPTGRRWINNILTPQKTLYVGYEGVGSIDSLLKQGLPFLRRFTGELQKLSQTLSTRTLSADPEELEQPTDDPRLELTPADSDRVLRALRECGAGLHGLAPAELIRAFRKRGVNPPSVEPAPPALSFLSPTVRILWDALYSGNQQGPPEWERFWGFHSPISHWVLNSGASQADQIAVSNGLFSAISEDLLWANQEVSQLSQFLERRIPGTQHARLYQMLREYVGAGVQPGAEVSTWLSRHLQGLRTDGEREDWSKAALRTILENVRSLQELLHFACHGGQGKVGLLDELRLRVAGGSLRLNVSFMASDLGLPEENKDETGRMVFLNACYTSAPTTEPPPFPEVWGKYGAVAILATLCAVPDYFAHAFASKFYEELFGPDDAPRTSCFVADALLATRRYFMKQYNNPLGLAYVLFAWPEMYVYAKPNPRRGAPTPEPVQSGTSG